MRSYFLSLFFVGAAQVRAASRTSPPSGALVVKSGTATSGQYSTLSEAVAALANDGSEQTIFIYAGTYNEQVYIDIEGSLTIYGETEDTTSYSSNQVTITQSSSLGTAGSDDATGTIRIHSDNVALYNINVKNTFGEASSNGQALAISAYGSNFGAYACGFYSYQDTVLAESGYQVYAGNYIEGAVDYIFGQSAVAWFEGNTLASIGPGAITAAGRTSSSDPQLYVFQSNTVTAGSSASSSTEGNVYLGRPWSEYARVVFLDTIIDDVINTAIWEEWSSSEPNTEDILFAEYDSTGSGIEDAVRPSFVTILTSSEAAGYSISNILGSDYTDWVDTSYLS